MYQRNSPLSYLLGRVRCVWVLQEVFTFHTNKIYLGPKIEIFRQYSLEGNVMKNC